MSDPSTGLRPAPLLSARPPLARAASSSEAPTLKAVSSEGITTRKVSSIWMILSSTGMPGSANWWCIPTGVESSRNSTNDSRASVSEAILPPAVLGSSAYQEM